MERGRERTKINVGYHWSYRLRKDDALTEFSDLNFIGIPNKSDEDLRTSEADWENVVLNFVLCFYLIK